jgi:transposase InsO family protein
MIAVGLLFVRMLCDCFKSRRRLEAEILILRHQLNVLRRAPRRGLNLRWVDRALFIWLYRCCPRILDAITIVRPETVVRWHRKGFVASWRWRSRSSGGRPRIAKEVRDLIRRMSFENPLWGATKIHGELLKLGIEVAQSTVSIYMVPRRGRPLQTWKTFLHNHMEGIASIDLFVVPTITFQQLFAFLVLSHQRRRLLWFAVTRNPTAEWLARQITEAFPWDSAPKYLIRDNDRAFGAAFKARVRAMGIRDRPTSFRSPWQNGYAERLVGSIRRECTDHLIVFNAEHLRRILAKYAAYYNGLRTHVFPREGCLARAQSSGSETLSPIRSSAGYTIDMHESDFSEATPSVSSRNLCSRSKSSCTMIWSEIIRGA